MMFNRSSKKGVTTLGVIIILAIASIVAVSVYKAISKQSIAEGSKFQERSAEIMAKSGLAATEAWFNYRGEEAYALLLSWQNQAEGKITPNETDKAWELPLDAVVNNAALGGAAKGQSFKTYLLDFDYDAEDSENMYVTIQSVGTGQGGAQKAITATYKLKGLVSQNTYNDELPPPSDPDWGDVFGLYGSGSGSGDMNSTVNVNGGGAFWNGSYNGSSTTIDGNMIIASDPGNFGDQDVTVNGSFLSLVDITNANSGSLIVKGNALFKGSYIYNTQRDETIGGDARFDKKVEKKGTMKIAGNACFYGDVLLKDGALIEVTQNAWFNGTVSATNNSKIKVDGNASFNKVISSSASFAGDVGGIFEYPNYNAPKFTPNTRDQAPSNDAGVCPYTVEVANSEYDSADDIPPTFIPNTTQSRARTIADGIPNTIAKIDSAPYKIMAEDLSFYAGGQGIDLSNLLNIYDNMLANASQKTIGTTTYKMYGGNFMVIDFSNVKSKVSNMNQAIKMPDWNDNSSNGRYVFLNFPMYESARLKFNIPTTIDDAYKPLILMTHSVNTKYKAGNQHNIGDCRRCFIYAYNMADFGVAGDVQGIVVADSSTFATQAAELNIDLDQDMIDTMAFYNILLSFNAETGEYGAGSEEFEIPDEIVAQPDDMDGDGFLDDDDDCPTNYTALTDTKGCPAIESTNLSLLSPRIITTLQGQTEADNIVTNIKQPGPGLRVTPLQITVGQDSYANISDLVDAFTFNFDLYGDYSTYSCTEPTKEQYEDASSIDLSATGQYVLKYLPKCSGDPETMYPAVVYIEVIEPITNSAYLSSKNTDINRIDEGESFSFSVAVVHEALTSDADIHIDFSSIINPNHTTEPLAVIGTDFNIDGGTQTSFTINRSAGDATPNNGKDPLTLRIFTINYLSNTVDNFDQYVQAILSTTSSEITVNNTQNSALVVLSQDESDFSEMTINIDYADTLDGSKIRKDFTQGKTPTVYPTNSLGLATGKYYPGDLVKISHNLGSCLSNVTWQGITCDEGQTTSDCSFILPRSLGQITIGADIKAVKVEKDVSGAGDIYYSLNGSTDYNAIPSGGLYWNNSEYFTMACGDTLNFKAVPSGTDDSFDVWSDDLSSQTENPTEDDFIVISDFMAGASFTTDLNGTFCNEGKTDFVFTDYSSVWGTNATKSGSVPHANLDINQDGKSDVDKFTLVKGDNKTAWFKSSIPLEFSGGYVRFSFAADIPLEKNTLDEFSVVLKDAFGVSSNEFELKNDIYRGFTWSIAAEEFSKSGFDINHVEYIGFKLNHQNDITANLNVLIDNVGFICEDGSLNFISPGKFNGGDFLVGDISSGIAISNSVVEFRWNRIVDATKYKLRIVDNENNVIIDSTVIGNSKLVTGILWKTSLTATLKAYNVGGDFLNEVTTTWATSLFNIGDKYDGSNTPALMVIDDAADELQLQWNGWKYDETEFYSIGVYKKDNAATEYFTSIIEPTTQFEQPIINEDLTKWPYEVTIEVCRYQAGRTGATCTGINDWNTNMCYDQDFAAGIACKTLDWQNLHSEDAPAIPPGIELLTPTYTSSTKEFIINWQCNSFCDDVESYNAQVIDASNNVIETLNGMNPTTVAPWASNAVDLSAYTGTTIKYRIQPVVGGVEGSWTEATFDVPTPEAVPVIEIRDPVYDAYQGDLTINWVCTSNCTEIDKYKFVLKAATQTDDDGTITSLLWHVGTDYENQTVTYSITAYNTEGVASNTLNGSFAVPEAEPIPEIEITSATYDRATGITTINWNYTANATNAEKVEIILTTDSGDETLTAYSGATSLTTNVLSSGRTFVRYTFNATPYNSQGFSGASKVSGVDVGPLSPEIQFTSETGDHESFTFKWDYLSGGDADSYIVKVLDASNSSIFNDAAYALKTKTVSVSAYQGTTISYSVQGLNDYDQYGTTINGTYVVPSAPLVELEVYTYDMKTGTNEIETAVRVDNISSETLDAGYKVRWYYTQESGTSVLDNWGVPSGVTVTDNSHTIGRYLEFVYSNDLSGSSSSPTSGWNYRIHQSTWSNYNKTNDFSYNGATSYTLNGNVTVYDASGTLIYGKAPVEPMTITSLSDTYDPDNAELELDWTSSGPVDAYKVEFTGCATLGNESNYTGTNLVVDVSGCTGSTVYYTVTPFNSADGDGTEDTGNRTITGPEPPEISITHDYDKDNSEITISWGPSNGIAATYYNVQITSTGSGCSYSNGSYSIDSYTMDVSGCYDETLNYSVTPYNGAGAGATQSGTEDIKDPNAAPSGLTFAYGGAFVLLDDGVTYDVTYSDSRGALTCKGTGKIRCGSGADQDVKTWESNHGTWSDCVQITATGSGVSCHNNW